MQKIFQPRMFMADWPLFAAYVPLFFVKQRHLQTFNIYVLSAFFKAYVPLFLIQRHTRRLLKAPCSRRYCGICAALFCQVTLFANF